MEVGDATIGITEVLPQANYAWLVTDDICALEAKISAAGSGWQISGPNPPDPPAKIIHATDPAGITWIIRQKN